jgi:hypothetical protein
MCRRTRQLPDRIGHLASKAPIVRGRRRDGDQPTSLGSWNFKLGSEIIHNSENGHKRRFSHAFIIVFVFVFVVIVGLVLGLGDLRVCFFFG